METGVAKTVVGGVRDVVEGFFVVVGGFEQVHLRSTSDLQGKVMPQPRGVYILIAAGGLVMLVGFFGCCGAVRESQCLLGSFFACLLIIFAAEVAAGVFGFLNKDTIIKDIQLFYKSSLNSNSTEIVTSYHRVLDCCGTEETPKTLCPDFSSDTKNCKLAIEDFFNSKLFIIGYVGIGIAGVMIIGMIFSMVLCCAIRNSRDVI
ncbi:CD9 antigen [Tachysurus ichikawai]